MYDLSKFHTFDRAVWHSTTSQPPRQDGMPDPQILSSKSQTRPGQTLEPSLLLTVRPVQTLSCLPSVTIPKIHNYRCKINPVDPVRSGPGSSNRGDPESKHQMQKSAINCTQVRRRRRRHRPCNSAFATSLDGTGADPHKLPSNLQAQPARRSGGLEDPFSVLWAKSGAEKAVLHSVGEGYFYSFPHGQHDFDGGRDLYGSSSYIFTMKCRIFSPR